MNTVRRKYYFSGTRFQFFQGLTEVTGILTDVPMEELFSETFNKPLEVQLLKPVPFVKGEELVCLEHLRKAAEADIVEFRTKHPRTDVFTGV